ncbi:hypothetical protein BP00DRAFT_451035 [Aspergillus indologenus CBS 114.80]|uniref:Uncharacterized protein n=1 Tax=Aspergillus indologenus CBS 114.80 TaxID=1450541 RepID=A0A2V5HPZ4_9EURO|nr:hypothetical protein BP00DRAFT_451035 [Aspergillus indologenus CBS 114.80]
MPPLQISRSPQPAPKQGSQVTAGSLRHRAERATRSRSPQPAPKQGSQLTARSPQPQPAARA